MIRKGLASTILIWSLVLPGNALALIQQQSQDDVVIPGLLYVRFADENLRVSANKSGNAAFDSKAVRYNVSAIEKAFPSLDVIATHRALKPSTQALRSIYVVHYGTMDSPRTVADDLARVPGVLFAEPVFKHQIYGRVPTTKEPSMVKPNDPDFSRQGNLTFLNLEEAWDVVKGEDSTVVIAIIDGGTDWRHTDLAANVWTNPGETDGDGIDNDNNGYVDDIHGWNFEDGTPDPISNRQSIPHHGTVVASLATAVTNNGTGIAGAAWNAQFMAFNSACGGGDIAQLCFVNPAIVYAAMNGADVINCSFGSYEAGWIDRMTVQSATDEGALLVASAGNDMTDNDIRPHYPSSFPEVLSVGGLGHSDDLSKLNYGKTVNVFAPALDLPALFPDDVVGIASGGTSYSAPQVSGVATLVKTAFPHYDANQVREQIRLTAVSIDAVNSPSGKYGRGRVDAYAAVTTPPQPAIRVTDWSYQNGDGFTLIRPADTVTVSVTFTNYLGSGSGLSAEMTSGNDYVKWETQTVSLGSMASGGTKTAAFSFTFASDAPDGGTVMISPKITAAGFEDSPDLLQVPFADFSIELAAVPDVVNEGDGPTEISLVAFSSREIIGPITFPITVTGSGVEGAVDFAPLTGLEVEMWRDQFETVYMFTLTPIDDQVDEVDETITISSTYSAVANSATITLTDNDEATPISLSASPTSVNEGDGSTTITITASSSTTYTNAQVLPITVAGSGVGGAVDFGNVSGFDLTLEASETTATGTFTLTPVDDNVDEMDETISITSSSPEVGGAATVTLVDNDATPDGVRLSVAPDDISEDDGQTTITVTASVSGNTLYGTAKTLNVTLNGSGVPGAVDFFAPVPESSLTVDAEASSGTVSFLLILEDDAEGEADEVITIGSDSVFVQSGATLVIRDDDGGRTSSEPDSEALKFDMVPPYPNPTPGPITFELTSPGTMDHVRLRLYNILGQEVAVPYDGPLRAGQHTVRFDGHHLPAGVYLYVFESSSTRISGRLVKAQ